MVDAPHLKKELANALKYQHLCLFFNVNWVINITNMYMSTQTISYKLIISNPFKL